MPFSVLKKRKAYQKKYMRKHYARHKEIYKARARKNTKLYVARNKKFVAEFKLKNGCCKCGYRKCSSAIDLHHNDPKIKDKEVARMVFDSNSIKKILNELKKCIVICCRCHRELHWHEEK